MAVNARQKGARFERQLAGNTDTEPEEASSIVGQMVMQTLWDFQEYI